MHPYLNTCIRAILVLHCKITINYDKDSKISENFRGRAKNSYADEKFGASKSTIYNALRYHTNSELASLIREAAINEFGGVEGKDVMKMRT